MNNIQKDRGTLDNQCVCDKLNEIEELEKRYFDLQMCDHWDSSDYKYAAELREKIKELKGEI